MCVCVCVERERGGGRENNINRYSYTCEEKLKKIIEFQNRFIKDCIILFFKLFFILSDLFHYLLSHTHTHTHTHTHIYIYIYIYTSTYPCISRWCVGNLLLAPSFSCSSGRFDIDYCVIVNVINIPRREYLSRNQCDLELNRSEPMFLMSLLTKMSAKYVLVLRTIALNEMVKNPKHCKGTLTSTLNNEKIELFW